MKTFLTHIFTGKDNTTWDFGRVLGGIAFVVGLSLEIYCVILSKPFDFTSFGTGIAAMAVGIGALLKLKETTEPGGEKK